MGFAAGDQNLYRFVGNEPTDDTDPSGLQKGVRGNGAVAFEGGILVIFSGESRDALLRAKGGWADEARAFAEEMMKRHPELTREQRLGVQNAVRHLYWMMLLTARYGEGAAKHIGDMHEYGENSIDSLIDQFHNALARSQAPDVRAKLCQTVDPIADQYKWMDSVPGNTSYVQMRSTLLEVTWKPLEVETKKSIRETITKLIDASAKDPFNGPLIIDPSDPRVRTLPGWYKGIPAETSGSNRSK